MSKRFFFFFSVDDFIQNTVLQINSKLCAGNRAGRDEKISPCGRTLWCRLPKFKGSTINTLPNYIGVRMVIRETEDDREN